MELARALSTVGTQVALATMGAPVSQDQREQLRHLPNVELFESQYRLEWMDDARQDLNASGDWLLSLAERIHPDLIHLNGYVHGALPWGVPSVVVAHSCVVSWWNAVLETDPPPSWNVYRQAVCAGLAGADAVVSISGAMSTALEAHYGFSHSAVVYNCSHDHRPAEKQNFVLTSGRAWDAAKNIRALDAVADSFEWPVCLAGETMHPQGGIAALPRLEALGTLPPAAMKLWFAHAPIYCLPARYEPFGLSILEAGLSGCALVLGDIPSLREIWGDAALLVDPSDNAALTAAIRSLIHSHDFRTAMGKRARERALEFTPEKMLTGYLGIYEQARTAFAATKEAATSCAS
jgi:glycosyltransferase involved in cell wall biosynthesis